MPVRTPSTHHDITIPGDVPIHVAVYPGGGPALVLIHGISGSGEVWLPILDEVSRHFTPVTLDLRGHGTSGKPTHGYRYDDYVGDLERTLDHLGIERPLVMGHSLGGLVTLWWAARNPNRAAAMVIEDSPLRSGEDFRDAFDGWIHLNSMTEADVRAYYASEHPHWKDEVADRRARQMVTTAPSVFTELKADSMANHGVDRIAEIEGITSPTLLIHGDPDFGGMVQPDDAASFEARLANASAVRIPEGSHGLHLDHTRDFLNAALPFLQRHAENASHLALPSGR